MDKRIRIIVGHYGSGKTEFAVNYALKLSEESPKVTIVDLDIVNPYFRSREKKQLFSERGIELISNSFDKDITAELPSLAANIHAPLQDKDRQVILDVGGDATGVRTLGRYKRFFTKDSYDLFFVVNANRPETDTFEKALEYVQSIEAEVGIKITGLINNTHMLENTSLEDIIKGNNLVTQLSHHLKTPVRYTCCIEKLAKDVPKEVKGELFVIQMIMREKWMMVD